MKRNRTLIAMTLILGLISVSCAKKIVAPTGEVLKVPRWYVNPPKDRKRLIAVAAATSRDLQTAIDKAKQEGRAEIARQLDVKMKALTKRLIEESGLGEHADLQDVFTKTTESVITDSLPGTRVAKQELGEAKGGFRAYVMMEMRLGRATARLVERIKQQAELYNNLRRSRTYRDLAQEAQENEDGR